MKNRFLADEAQKENRLLLQVKKDRQEFEDNAIARFKAKPLRTVKRGSHEWLHVSSRLEFMSVFDYAEFLRPYAKRDEVGCDPHHRYLIQEADA